MTNRKYILAVICLVAVVNYVDRQILSVLLEPIKQELGVSDSAMGLLTGMAFAIFYVGAGIPLARMADVGNRRNLIAACMTVWSVATVLCGMAQNFLQLAIARTGVASGEAGAVPASQSMLADLYPPQNRGSVMGILSAAQAVGMALGLFLGGWLSQTFGWRVAFIVVGLPGIFLALLMRFTVSEPIREKLPSQSNVADGEDVPALRQVLRFVLNTAPLRYMLLVGILCSLTGYTIMSWGPTFYVRIHQMTTFEVGIWMGLAAAGGLLIGNIGSGHFADKYAKGDNAKYMHVGALGTFLALPFILLFIMSSSKWMSLGGFFLGNLLMSFWMAPTYTVIMGIAPPRMRALVAAILSLCMMLLGAGMGPFIVGILNDVLEPRFGVEAIRYSLLICSSALLLCGGLCLLASRACRNYKPEDAHTELEQTASAKA